MSDKNAKDVYGHVLKYTGIFGGVQGLNIAMGLVRNKIVALLLGPGGMGMVALFNSVVNFMSQATSLGVSFSAVRNIAEMSSPDDAPKRERFIKVTRAWSLVAALIGVLACLALGSTLSWYASSSAEYSTDFMLLAPVVGMMAVTGGETAILKGERRLRDLALIQLISVAASVVVAVPIYYFLRLSGIVPALLLTALASMVATLFYSCRLHPPRLNGAFDALGEGAGMIRLGVAFILSGVMTSGSEMVIRSFLNVEADLNTVGLYNAGYVLTVTYAAMVFSAMETDYFPRLSAVNHDKVAFTLTANRQIEVSLLIISPMLAFLMVALPVLVPLLYSGRFAPVVPMSQVTVLSMYLKAMTLPVAYMTLAKGHSLAFLALEAAYALVFVGLIVVGFRSWGLFGTGVALLAAHVFDFVMILAYARTRYGYRVSRPVALCSLIQLPLGVAAYLVTFVESGPLYVALAACVVMASAAVSVKILHDKTELWNKLLEKTPLKRFSRQGK